MLAYVLKGITHIYHKRGKKGKLVQKQCRLLLFSSQVLGVIQLCGPMVNKQHHLLFFFFQTAFLLSVLTAAEAMQAKH